MCVILHIHSTDNTVPKGKVSKMRFVEKKNVYENIASEIKTLIENGVLRRGDKLPSVRAYAVERRVNPNTVAKAYFVLEEEGYIQVELKKGAYVCYGDGAPRKELEEIKRQMLVWKAAGVSLEECKALLEEIYGEGGVI